MTKMETAQYAMKGTSLNIVYVMNVLLDLVEIYLVIVGNAKQGVHAQKIPFVRLVYLATE